MLVWLFLCMLDCRNSSVYRRITSKYQFFIYKPCFKKKTLLEEEMVYCSILKIRIIDVCLPLALTTALADMFYPSSENCSRTAPSMLQLFLLDFRFSSEHMYVIFKTSPATYAERESKPFLRATRCTAPEVQRAPGDRIPDRSQNFASSLEPIFRRNPR